jgi:hypothetical protein
MACVGQADVRIVSQGDREPVSKDGLRSALVHVRFSIPGARAKAVVDDSDERVRIKSQRVVVDSIVRCVDVMLLCCV